MQTRTNLTGARLSLAGLLTLLVLSGAVLAADAPTVQPECGAPGDAVLIRGADFGEDPDVEFDGVDAEVLRSTADRILCLVPEDASEGAVDVTVDGDLADGDFTVLPEGSPVVYRMSPETAVPGARIILIGRRLGGGEARFIDSSGSVAATVDPRGGRRAIVVEVPDDLDAGQYTLEIENKDELDTDPCSPTITIVAADTPEITAIEPDAALPGERIKIAGTDLGPRGPCRIVWEDSSGDQIESFGHANGYDRIVTHVPFRAEAGESYEVTVELRGDVGDTNTLDYEVGTPDAPEITDVDPDTAPAGGVFRIRGTDLVVIGERPSATLTQGSTEIELDVLGGTPGIPERFKPLAGNGSDRYDRDEILVRIPRDADEGDYDLTVTVGDRTSDAVDFTVGLADLSVTRMRPNTQSGRFAKPIVIEGAGFGSRGVVDIAVTFDDGSGGDPEEGRVLVHLDDLLLVAPPGNFRNPLPKGTYEVRVVRDPDGSAESVKAGDYTVR